MFKFIRNIKQKFILKQMANFFEKVDRNPVLRTPKEIGLDFEDVDFKTIDNVNLKAWFIPSKDSKKTVVFNHFMLGNKAGAIPNKDWGNVTVDFMPIYKHLVNAGYNVFTYDLRNHGESDVYQNGKLGLTSVEYKDVISAVKYVKQQYANNDLYLYSQCYGTVSTIRAIGEAPEVFKDIKAFVNIQPLVPSAFVEAISRKFKIWDDRSLSIFENQLQKKTGYTFENVKIPAEKVNIPTLTLQVRKDWRTTTASIENIHENLATTDKKILWIEEEEERLEGYNYFAKQPQKLIDWLNKY